MFNVAHGYRLKTGVEAVREARASAERCTADHSNLPKGMYTDARSDAWDNIGYDLLGVVEFAKPGGVEDACGRCMKGDLSVRRPAGRLFRVPGPQEPAVDPVRDGRDG